MQFFRLMYPHIGSLIGLFRLCGYCSELPFSFSRCLHADSQPCSQLHQTFRDELNGQKPSKASACLFRALHLEHRAPVLPHRATLWQRT